MPFESTTVLALVLLAVGWGLLAWHILEWRAARSLAADDAALRFARSRFSRRLQTSSLIVVLGLLVPWSPHITTPKWLALFWLLVLLITLWILCLAIGDLIIVRLHVQRRHHAERVKSLAAAAKSKAERPERNDESL